MANTAQRCFYWHSRVVLVKRSNFWHLNKCLAMNSNIKVLCADVCVCVVGCVCVYIHI